MWIPSLFILHRRTLTEGERQLANSVFGRSLYLDDIHIVAHRLMLRYYAMSPNGQIYFNRHDWKADFSLESLEIQSWLIHELTHVWQIQQGVAVVQKALLDRRYRYVLQAGKSFWNYGIEQQAQMVQDYFVQSRRGQDCTALKCCLPFHHSD
ncbi:MAG: type IV secretion protein Rhs [Acinetobacter sp.]|jgi:hypothetical protein|nr:MAG: type IV secretion protein Rhs [Acinetobacter sp.]